MIGAFFTFGGATVVAPLVLWSILNGARIRTPVIAVTATQYLLYLLCAPIVFRFHLDAYAGFGVAIALSVAATAATWICLRVPAARLASCSTGRDAVVIAVLSVAAVLPNAYIYAHQGYFSDTGRSLFAAPFAGDQLRNANIIAALVDGRQAVYFPHSILTYQITWHYAVANATALLPHPEFSWLPRALGASLVTGALFFATLLWLVAVLRRANGARSPGLYIVLLATGVLAASDADIVGATWTYVTAHHIGMAADASTALTSNFRYFSAALIAMTSPQHASFFIAGAMAAAFAYDPRFAGPSRSASVLSAPGAMCFAAVAGVLEPLLFVLCAAPLGIALVLLYINQPRRLLRLVAAGFVIVAAVAALHQLVLGFSVVDLFVRPRVTGGGSGHYGVELLWQGRALLPLVASVPALVPEALGIPGIVFAVALLFCLVRNPGRIWDPLPLMWICTLLLWNVVVVETEIQRHASMIAAVLSVVGIGLTLPAGIKLTQRAVQSAYLIVAAVAAFLDGVLVQHYSSGGSYLPLAVPWRDYFCVANLIRSRYPGLPVVTRTPDNLELPIAAEATTAMVWSQVAFVHQRVTAADASLFDRLNPRDRQKFKQAVLADPGSVRRDLAQLGFRGVVWGPVEEDGWGPQVRAALTTPEGFLASCGRVALYALNGTGANLWSTPDASTKSQIFLAQLLDPREQICRPAGHPVIELQPAASVPGKEPGEVDIALHKPATMSTSLGAAANGVDGLVGTPGHPAPLVHSNGSDPSPWWQVDLGEVRQASSIRLYRRTDCCRDQLRDFYVLVSTKPFPSRALLPSCTASDVTVFHHRLPAGPVTVIPVNAPVRFVRVQLPDYGFLAFEELEVMAPPP